MLYRKTTIGIGGKKKLFSAMHDVFSTNFCQFCTYQTSTAPLNYYSVLSEIPTREFWRRIRIRGISRNFLDRNKEYSRVGIGARARERRHIFPRSLATARGIIGVAVDQNLKTLIQQSL